jgi:adenine deaminase
MQKNAKTVPMKFFFGVPSCVPASPIEKSGAVIGADEVEKLINEQDFYYLSEMMNFPGVVYNDKDVWEKLQATKKAGKRIDGHAPGLEGENLKKYIDAGITTDHECSSLKEATEKIELGMKVLIREGSAAKNFDNLVPLLVEHSDSIMFCTDDCHPDYLKEGHINKVVARAVSLGYDLFDVIKVACVNPIEHYGLPLGHVRVNDPANFVVVNDIESFEVLETHIDGKKVYSNKSIDLVSTDAVPPPFPFRDKFEKNRLNVIATGEKINVIGAIEGELITKWLNEDSPVQIGEEVVTDSKNDFLKIVLLDRYENTNPVVGFIRGFGLKSGAIAASIAHDSHHIIAVGCDDTSIDEALEWIVNNRGGLCFAKSHKVEGISLPFFGLMTNKDGGEVSERYEEINQQVKQNGCTLASPFMTASFMALTVIPELKIYHKGLFDGTKFQHVELFG